MSNMHGTNIKLNSKFLFSKAITNSTIQRHMTGRYRVRKSKYMEGSGRGLTQDICRSSVRVLGRVAENRMLCITNKAWMFASTQICSVYTWKKSTEINSYLMNEQKPIPWSRVLLAKLIFPHLVSKLPRILYNRELHHRLIPSQKNSVHTLQTDFLNVHFNITLPSTSRSSKRSFFFRFRHQNAPFLSSCVPHVPPITFIFIWPLKSVDSRHGTLISWAILVVCLIFAYLHLMLCTRTDTTDEQRQNLMMV
jgi:hypothetical protein